MREGESKESRNRVLLVKMLSLDNPVVTPHMITFLEEEGVIEQFIGFVSRLPAKSAAEVGSDLIQSATESNSVEYLEAMKLSYNCMVGERGLLKSLLHGSHFKFIFLKYL